ncbi:hypothetical protein [Rhodovulum sp.]|uniref:hypothetical protein n=1 Tax=Rhodovulum sp. TaxID=34009 RepID=UPI00257F3C1A|nr:hypothetical protein [Rhodovulum sp.]
MRPNTTARGMEKDDASAADRHDIWREVLSAEGNGPVPGDAGLEPLLDRIGRREAAR